MKKIIFLFICLLFSCNLGADKDQKTDQKTAKSNGQSDSPMMVENNIF